MDSHYLSKGTHMMVEKTTTQIATLFFEILVSNDIISKFNFFLSIAPDNSILRIPNYLFQVIDISNKVQTQNLSNKALSGFTKSFKSKFEANSNQKK
uniref:CSON007019 protein n=1 Tax=Culicoides sonorensis TaxID=179676 RepID=A0A336LWZ6_CULSO